MKVFYEGEHHEVYGEPTRSMIEELHGFGMQFVEHWPGEIASYYAVAGQEVSPYVAAAIVSLCSQA
jgi:hypothetical protein